MSETCAIAEPRADPDWVARVIGDIFEVCSASGATRHAKRAGVVYNVKSVDMRATSAEFTRGLGCGLPIDLRRDRDHIDETTADFECRSSY